MSRHDDGVRVRHMLDHAREAVEICATRTRADLDSDRLFNLALVRLIEIVGEAGTKISIGLRERHPDVHGERSSRCGIGSSTAMTRWTLTSFGLLSQWICRRL